MRRLSYTVVLLMLMSAGCSNSNTASDLDHGLGATRRKPSSKLLSCKENAAVEDSVPAGNAYLKKLAQHIAARNPKTFSGVFAIGNFCFTVTRQQAVNANAAPISRWVTFYAGIFKYLKNDAEVAAVLAHEMAHVTMQHGQGGTVIDVADDESIARAEELAYAEDNPDSVVEEDGSGLEDTGESNESEPMQLAGVQSWEVEADEVGLELYLRAGFQYAYFPHLFEALVNTKDLAACRKKVKQGNEPSRGSDGHPDPCWRVYDALVKEKKAHKAAYDALSAKAKTINLFGDLAKVKKALGVK